MTKIYFGALLICLGLGISCGQNASTPMKGSASTTVPGIEELSHSLWANLLNHWYPACIDSSAGGYYSNLDSSFAISQLQEKMIVSQARHVWTTSMVAKFFKKPEYLGYARHGFEFLRRVWDARNGGFPQEMNQNGDAINDTNHKTAYGNAFGIYGLAAYFDASGDTNALNLAIKTFKWLEAGAHDSKYGGYFQDLDSTGKPKARSVTTGRYETIGYKDYNSSIHLLEAFTSLYKIWPDSLLRTRLAEMNTLVKDTMIGKKGYLSLYFTPDWKQVRLSRESRDEIMQHRQIDHVSFGHDIETAYLLKEAAAALNPREEISLMQELKRITDISLKGFDSLRGGLFDEGFYFSESGPMEIIADSKVWWAQAEALNTLDIMAQHFPEEGYNALLEKQWNYINKYVIDTVHGGWLQFGLDTSPNAKSLPKGSIWKVTYHDGRALMEMILRRENQKDLQGKH